MKLIRHALCAAFLATTAFGGEVSFNEQIRPILSENCFQCHGPDADARAADLRLDTHEGAHEYAIVAGSPDESEVISRIFSEDPDMVMPPPDSERKLTSEQQELISQWIVEGADYEKHWSFRPVESPAVPQISQASGNPIDAFIRSRLMSKGLHLAEAADRATFIRRATFTLTGLPPTIEEIDAFIDDQSDDAFEKVVDRLLASSAYGERMTADWLDVARYSDTYGYQVDRDRFVWPWRDWVIDAFNDNMPYDQFVTEQIAGDLLPNPDRSQILATTFNRLHPQKVEGGSVPEEFRIEYVADRAQTVATAFLGLTMECCRCHSHKYDPIQHREYYELTAFFDNIDEAGLYSYFTDAIPTPTLTLPTEEEEKRLQLLQQKVRESASAFAASLKDAEDGHQSIDLTSAEFAEAIFAEEFENKPSGRNTQTEGVAGFGIRLTGDDAFDTKVGNFSRSEAFSVSLWLNAPVNFERAVVFHRSRAWTDAASRGYQLLIEDGKLSWSLIHFWPGNAIRIVTTDAIPVDKWTHVTVTYDGSSKANGLKIFVDGKKASSSVVRDDLSKNITGGGGDSLQVGERFRDFGFKNGVVDRLKVFDVELTPLEIKRLSSVDERVGSRFASRSTLGGQPLRRSTRRQSCFGASGVAGSAEIAFRTSR